MNLIKICFIALLSFLIACSESSILDPVNDAAPGDSELTSSLNKNGSEKPVKVHRTKKEIVIDGKNDDWTRNGRIHKLRLEVDAGTQNPIENKKDLSSDVRMLWDDENLYFFASIWDEEININGVQLFERDGLEIYIDGANNKNVGILDFPPPNFTPAGYEDNVDFFRFIPDEGASSDYGIIDVSKFDFVIIKTSRGYDVEVKMPFADLPGFPAGDKTGHEFGVEFQTNDNDNDVRQNFLKWNSALDDSYFNPSLFGTAVLEN
jgi:hypothetical protein